MKFCYQLILLGDYVNDQKDELLNALYGNLDAIGFDRAYLNVIEHSTTDVESIMPSYCIFFGSNSGREEQKACKLMKQGISVLPIVYNEQSALVDLHDPEIKKINAGFVCEGYDKISAVALVGLGLTRAQRKVFISYKRSESQDVALQLYERLGAAGFSVFLDTHCIEKGVDFQEDLMHQMVDCDVILLLNSAHFFDSHWTMEEFHQANTMHIGIVQVLWPTVLQKDDCFLTTPISLDCGSFDFCGKKNSIFLRETAITNIVKTVEKMRMRSFCARRMYIIDNLTKTYKAKNISLCANPDGKLFDPIHNEIIIPEIAYPKSESFITASSINKFKCSIVYNETNVKEKWRNYLNWLNKSLPVKTKTLQEMTK